MRGLLFEVMAL